MVDSNIGNSIDDDDSDNGWMGWIGDALDTPDFLITRYIFAVVVGISAIILFTYILIIMECQTTTYHATMMESAVGERDTQLELEEETNHTSTSTTTTTKDIKASSNSNNNNNGDYVQAIDDYDDDDDHDTITIGSNSPNQSPKGGGGVVKNITMNDIYKLGDTRRRLLTTQQYIRIYIHVFILLLFNYLLLVYIPGSMYLSFFAIVVIAILTLQSYLYDEIYRRQRYDRIMTMMALFSIIAGSFTLITYCRLALREGNIYEGPARIIGYDDSSYTNNDGTTMRANLQVAWGNMWGCPDEGGIVCTATVQGALCETKYDVPSNNGYDRRRHRHIESVVEDEVQEYQNEQERDEQYNDPAEKAEEEAEENAEASGSYIYESIEGSNCTDTDMYGNCHNGVTNLTMYSDVNGEIVVENEEIDDKSGQVIYDTVEDVPDPPSEYNDEEIEVEIEDEEEIEDLESENEEDEEDITTLSTELTTEEIVDENVEDTLIDQVNVLESNSTNADTEEELTDIAVVEAAEGGIYEGEADELENENEDLKDELGSEEEVVGELEEEIEDLENNNNNNNMYVYDDVVYEDDYWQQQDWDSIWGEYACEDLFNGDLDGIDSGSVDAYGISNTAPGNDQWPTVNIYGSCNTCTAYIIDYYSTEHFHNILDYEYQSRFYLIVGFFLLVAAAFTAIVERFRPKKDQEIVLLSNDGGVPA